MGDFDSVPIFVINLERREDRRKSFSEKNDWLLDDMVKYTKAVDAKNTDEIEPHRQYTDGRYACFKSHENIWDEIINGSWPKNQWFIVAEDDALIMPDLKKDWKTIKRKMWWKGKNVGVLHWRMPYLKDDAPTIKPGSNNGGVRLEKIEHGFHGTHLYMVNKKGAQAMRNEYDSKGNAPIDICMSNRKLDTIVMVNSRVEYGGTYDDHVSDTENAPATNRIDKNPKQLVEEAKKESMTVNTPPPTENYGPEAWVWVCICLAVLLVLLMAYYLYVLSKNNA